MYEDRTPHISYTMWDNYWAASIQIAGWSSLSSLRTACHCWRSKAEDYPSAHGSPPHPYNGEGSRWSRSVSQVSRFHAPLLDLLLLLTRYCTAVHRLSKLLYCGLKLSFVGFCEATWLQVPWANKNVGLTICKIVVSYHVDLQYLVMFETVKMRSTSIPRSVIWL